MNRTNFEKLLDKMIEEEKLLLNYKRGEYAKNTVDVLVNFKQNAAFLERSPEEICLAYTMKHIQSISRSVMSSSRMGTDLKFEWVDATGKEGLAQRFADARNYLVLLGALIKEKEDAI
jgi:hypothetical protein